MVVAQRWTVWLLNKQPQVCFFFYQCLFYGKPRLAIIRDHWADRMFCGLDEWHFWWRPLYMITIMWPVWICGCALFSCIVPGLIMELQKKKKLKGRITKFFKLFNLELSVFNRKSQTLALPCWPQTITETVWQGLGWRFSDKSSLS